MYSYAWINGQYQQVGPSSQPSQAATQLIHDVRRNPEAGTACKSRQNITSIKGVRPSQGFHFPFGDGDYFNRQTSANPHPHQNYAQNAATQSLPNMMNAYTTYPQQYMSAHRNAQLGKQSMRTPHGNAVSNLQQCKVQNSLFRNVNVESTKSVPVYTTTATSLPHKRAVCTSRLESATTRNRQTAHNHNHRQNSTQHGFPVDVSQTIQQQPTQLSSTNNSTSYIHSNSYSRQCENSCFLSQTSELPLNPAADTQDTMIRRQLIAMIEDDLRNSFTAGAPPPYTSSPNREKQQFVSGVRMTESNQNMQPVTLSVTESYNANTFQSLPSNSGLSVPKKTHSVMSRPQHGIDVPPQQSFFSVTASEANAFIPESNTATKGKLVESLSDACQLMTLPETQSPVANNCEMLSPVTPNKGFINQSPGRTGTRAVAVVQPLSQETCKAASRDTSFNTINQAAECSAADESEKSFISPGVAKSQKAPFLEEGFYPENQKQMSSNNSVISHSTASSYAIYVSSSDSAEHQDLSEKRLCADDSGSELAINRQGDQRESGADPKSCVHDLSSVPTIPWTVATLTKLIQDGERAQMEDKRHLTPCVSATLLGMFWGGSNKSLILKLRKGWYNDLITNVTEFCVKHVTVDSVILSEVKNSFEQQLKFCVLKDNEVYSEPPYKSSWLNVNEQVDDIDKEFGSHWSLTQRLNKSASQPDWGSMVNSIPTQTVSEASNKILSQTELEPNSSEEKQASTVETASTPTSSPSKTQGADSSDPCYSFEIQVLPPEEARVIFEQAQSKVPQSVDTDSRTERVTNSPVVREVAGAIDGTLKNSKLKKSKTVREEVCCLNRWMEIIFRSNTSPLGDCQCKNEQNHASKNNEITVYSLPEPCNEASQTIVLTEDDEKPDSHSDPNPNPEEPTNLSHISINSSQSSIILISEDENLSDETEIPKQIIHSEKDSEQAHVNTEKRSKSSGSDNNERETKAFSCCGTETQVDCVQDQLKCPGSTQSCTSASSDIEIESLPSSESEVARQMSDLDEDHLPAPLAATDVAEPSLETQTGATFSLSEKDEAVERKRKRLSTPDIFLPGQKKSNKCPGDVPSQPILEDCSKSGNVFDGATESNTLSSGSRTVELVLFGSALQDKSVSVGGKKGKLLSPEAGAVPGPPEVLAVSLSPLKKKSTETVTTGEYSARQWVHKNWLQSFIPTKIGHKNKLKCNFATLSKSHLKKAESVGLTNTKELPVSSEMSVCKRNKLKRKRPHSGLRHEEKKTKKDAVTLKRPCDRDVMLRFNVLPDTFRFKDGSSGRKKTNDPVATKSKY